MTTSSAFGNQDAKRILKFNKDKADELIQKIKAEIAEIDKDLSEMVRVTIEWFTPEREVWKRPSTSYRD